MFKVMLEKLVERKKRINEALGGKHASTVPNERVVSDTELFHSVPKIKVVKDGS